MTNSINTGLSANNFGRLPATCGRHEFQIAWSLLNFCIGNLSHQRVIVVSMGRPVKFMIEVLRIGDDTVEVLNREEFKALGPKWVKSRAQELLRDWKKRSANGARVVNETGQQIYYWRED